MIYSIIQEMHWDKWNNMKMQSLVMSKPYKLIQTMLIIIIIKVRICVYN